MIPVLWWARPAAACGGFFCSAAPVDQAEEDVLFVVDDLSKTTTMHVEVAYSGPAEQFAWVVPVPREPEIGLSTPLLFQGLHALTRPQMIAESTGEDCGLQDRRGPPPPPPSAASGTSLYVETDHVGPYETAVLRADDSAALIDWLQANSYDLPDNVDSALAPYVADGSWFVAIKLAKGETTGALQPIQLTWPGTGMSIPLALTAIAATEDMGLRVHVLGTARAVPDSYLHVVLDDLVLEWAFADWFKAWDARRAFEYEDVLARAADEAGGHAFVTEFAGPASLMAGRLWTAERYDLEAVASADPAMLVQLLTDQGLIQDPSVPLLVRQYLPMPQALAEQGITTPQFYNCVQCYLSPEELAALYDGPGLAAALEQRVVGPLRQVQEQIDALGDSGWLTRMSTALSPDEMGVDPTFVFNRDLPQEVRMGRAQLDHLCEDFRYSWNTAPLSFVLPDGRAYDLPSEAWMWDHDTSPRALLSPLMDRMALRIEDLGASGPPVVLADYTEEALQEARQWNLGAYPEPFPFPHELRAGPATETGACGCDGAAGQGTWLAPLGVLALLRRRSLVSLAPRPDLAPLHHRAPAHPRGAGQ